MTRNLLLRGLGIVGWDALEPAILAALATEAPLLLVGAHGSAKTLLLAWLADALGLAFRHYNASILSFNDLLGYPVPQDGRLVYLETPATIWQAEAVLFDEVSRCRPELQNKLFPLIHERVAQGVPLARLKHRWAAMNPPPREDDRASTTGGTLCARNEDQHHTPSKSVMPPLLVRCVAASYIIQRRIGELGPWLPWCPHPACT